MPQAESALEPRRHAFRIKPSFAHSARDAPAGDVRDLRRFFERHRRVAVITGAGCSTGSGIPAYRDGDGHWRRRQPIFHQDFISHAHVRRRYWARSFFGWPAVGAARPNAAHLGLARLEQVGRVATVVTQNVDGLHGVAGQQSLVELHGGLQRVNCLQCGRVSSRERLQARLLEFNPDWAPEISGINPDGDAELDEQAYPDFRVADCESCGGVLQPDVVFFGGCVPRVRAGHARETVLSSDALLVVGSSLAVWSSLRLVREASASGLPVVAINDGRTRADELLQFKIPGQCETHLSRLADDLASTGPQ